MGDLDSLWFDAFVVALLIAGAGKLPLQCLSGAGSRSRGLDHPSQEVVYLH